jgi:hypothetical protein
MVTYNKLIEGKTAFEKARALNPRTVRIDGDGGFAVAGYNDIYLLTINDASLSDTLISCDCRAGQLNKPCYHAAAVLIAKLTDDADKRRAEQEAAAAPKASQQQRLINYIDMNLLNEWHSDYANFLDICCTVEISEKAAAWFALPEDSRPTFANFAGI